MQYHLKQIFSKQLIKKIPSCYFLRDLNPLEQVINVNICKTTTFFLHFMPSCDTKKEKKLLTFHKDLKECSLSKLGTHEAGNCQSVESRVSVSGLGTTDDYFFIFFNFPSLSLNTFFTCFAFFFSSFIHESTVICFS